MELQIYNAFVQSMELNTKTALMFNCWAPVKLFMYYLPQYPQLSTILLTIDIAGGFMLK